MIKVLGGSTKAFVRTARGIVANGGDLYAWLFDHAPVGYVAFTTEHLCQGEYAEGTVRLERTKGGGQARRSSVDLRFRY